MRPCPFMITGIRFMKKYIFRTIKLLCLMLALALSVGVLQEYVLCHADHNRQRIKGFYDEDKDSLDVVFMGASEIYSDFAPGYAYKYKGITSYLFATQANSILNYKAQLKNILSRQNPKLIVIELNGAVAGDKKETTKEENLRNYADNVPLDVTKLEWIQENVDKHYEEYLFPILKYHGVWKDVPDNMLYQSTVFNNKTRGYNYLKGILNETNVFKSPERPMNSWLKDMGDTKQPLEQIEEKALRDLLQFCKDEKLDNVLFVRFPHIVVRRTEARFYRSNTVGDIVAEYGFNYLNLERDVETTGIDENTDFYNLDHFNIYGQKKFTEFMTDYMIKNCGVAPHELSESQKDEWQTSARYYDAYYKYSDNLIKSGDRRELSEDNELIDKLKEFI